MANTRVAVHCEFEIAMLLEAGRTRGHQKTGDSNHFRWPLKFQIMD